MAGVEWTREALAKLELIPHYIQQFDPRAARRIAERLYTACESLVEFPNRGRPARGDCRELTIVRPYVILYEVAGDRVSILDIRHAAQLSDQD